MNHKQYKTVRIFSRQNFNKYIKEHHYTDENIETKDIAIIEFFNSEICEGFCNYNHSEDEFNYRNDFNSRPFKGNHSNIFQIECDDILGHKTINYIINNKEIKEPLIYFKYIDAIAIYNFILKNINKKKFIIHCSAGISRSGACGLFIYEFLKNKNIDVHIPELNYIHPNSLIYDMLNIYNNLIMTFDENIELRNKYRIYVFDENNPDKILLIPYDYTKDDIINNHVKTEYLSYTFGGASIDDIIRYGIKYISELVYEELLKDSDNKLFKKFCKISNNK